MADFDLIQTDAQVQSILNDGQNMQGAGAQTTLTTESVLLKDVNGNYHKILKSSFTEAIRDTLAGLLVNNDKGTTINQIAAIASGDFGSITPANLASVLGGVFRISQTTFSIDNAGGSYEMTGLVGCWILMMTTNQWDISAIVLVSKPAGSVKVLGYHGGSSKTVGTESTNDVQFIHNENSETVTVKSNDLSRSFRVTKFEN